MNIFLSKNPLYQSVKVLHALILFVLDPFQAVEDDIFKSDYLKIVQEAWSNVKIRTCHLSHKIISAINTSELFLHSQINTTVICMILKSDHNQSKSIRRHLKPCALCFSFTLILSSLLSYQQRQWVNCVFRNWTQPIVVCRGLELDLSGVMPANPSDNPPNPLGAHAVCSSLSVVYTMCLLHGSRVTQENEIEECQLPA